ncbi:MAG: BLUF domain-containing protein [Methylococcaceae bacterium]
MKRIMYISTTTRKLSDDEVDEIGRRSVVNNAKAGVTGILLSAHEFFFQILEGEEEDVTGVLNRIRRDVRHQDVLILKAENDVESRLFSKWSMKTIRLDDTNDLILQAIRIMLENITESHRIIERYTQPAVLQFLTEGVNPLTVPVKKTEQIILFGDIVAFSYLSGVYPVEEVAELVNCFLEICSRCVVEQGGQVSKYVGDCVMAHFPADAADSAIRACINTLEAISSLRHNAGQCRLLKFLYCGFGLSKGQVIEGNFGSFTKMDYTVLGDIVNVAARLEGLTRNINRCIALSDPVREACSEPWDFEQMGEFHLKGQIQPQPIYSINNPLVTDMKTYEDILELVGGVCELPDEPQ